jgi:hypothetical protein
MTGRVHMAPAQHLAWFRRPAFSDAAVVAGVLVLALLVAAATLELPIQVVLPGIALTIGIAVLGPEFLIVVALLAGTGLMPFMDPGLAVVAGVKGSFFFFLIAAGTMMVTWSARVLAGRPSWPLRPNVLMLGALLLLVWVGFVMGASDPLSQPSLAAPFFEFPAMAVVTYLWLSHDDALAGLRRVLPVAVAIITAWAVGYIAGAGGCGVCKDAVSADLTNVGLLGPNSRLYTPGQNTLLALVLVCFGQALRRPTAITVGLTLVGVTSVALQASRAQYLALAAGMIVLMAWKLGQQRAGGRLALIAATMVVVVALLNTSVGERAVTGYEDVSASTGTWGYRVGLVEKTSESWSLLGSGISAKTFDLGFNVDLGLPNTVLVLGIVGAVLQIALLALAVLRGISAGTLAGATLAAIFALVLVARPTLPLIEYGHSAIAYGAAVGFAAWLFADRPRAAKLAPAATRRNLAR